MSETAMIVLGAIGLLAAGIGLGFGLAQLRRRSDAGKADAVQQEFDDYKREVTQHFGRTADHFKAIGREYRELYEHMAGGADALCDREALDSKLSFAPKAILESIAEEQPEADKPKDYAPQDTADADATVAAAASDDEAPDEDEPKPDSAVGVSTEAEAETEDDAGRTLH